MINYIFIKKYFFFIFFIILNLNFIKFGKIELFIKNLFNINI